MHLFDYIVIIIFSAGILIAGISFSGSGKNMRSFEEIEGELKCRVYPVSDNTQTVFYGKDGESKSVISTENPDWEELEIIDVTTDRKVDWEKSRFAFQFNLEEGHDYRIK